tara:strand:+ start:58261 stop:58791 length:531 start_codon:yes stop_codon:yes gene_type:complete
MKSLILSIITLLTMVPLGAMAISHVGNKRIIDEAEGFQADLPMQRYDIDEFTDGSIRIEDYSFLHLASPIGRGVVLDINMSPLKNSMDLFGLSKNQVIDKLWDLGWDEADLQLPLAECALVFRKRNGRNINYLVTWGEGRGVVSYMNVPRPGLEIQIQRVVQGIDLLGDQCLWSQQ